jgi:hypothetical protein
VEERTPRASGMLAAFQSVVRRRRAARCHGPLPSPLALSMDNRVSNCGCEPVRIISAQCDFSPIAQRHRYGVEARNIVKPPIRRWMNTLAIPPANANGLASFNLSKPNPLADNAGSK